MSAYPAAFDATKFPAIPSAVIPVPRKPAETLIAKAPIEVQSALRLPAPLEAYISSLCIQGTADLSKISQSFQNKDTGRNAPVAVDSHFHFLPGFDAVAIHWEVTNPQLMVKARFELWSMADQDNPIWFKEYADGEAKTLMEGDNSDGKGSLAWAAVKITGADTKYPDHIPNAANAPYQLRLTVTSKAGMITAAWTYFDVMVDSLQLNWGDRAKIPAGDIQDVMAIYLPLTRRDEVALIDGLSAVSSAIDPTVDIELKLRSTNAAYVNLNEWYAWRDFGFLRYQARWGQGPRIPVLAKVLMKSMGDTAENSADALKALGPARFLWDWCDKPEADRQQYFDDNDALDAVSTFVITGLKYKENAAGEPPACLNCHADRGGKRGGPNRVFPEFNTAAAFPFLVTKPATRVWGAFTGALTGALTGYTGVIFQPCRMAMDSYRLRVFFAPPGFEATLDVGTPMDTLVTAHPGLPTARTGWIEMLRQVDARYTRKSADTPRVDLDEVTDAYRLGGIEIVWTEDFWTQIQFNQCLTASLAPDNSSESAALIRNRIFQPNARGRRQGLNAWTSNVGMATVPSVVKAELAKYDQWLGSNAGALAPTASAAHFTLPGRDQVEAQFIAPAVQTYIAKDRNINDKLRKWNTLKTANPLVPDPELRVRFFYNVLNQVQRDKILPTIKQNYIAAGWQGWDTPRDRPEEWANLNYNYRTSKLVYLSDEMHVRKVLQDAFEGVTVFHYQHFFDAVNADWSIYSRQCQIGGVAAISMNADIGLSGAFSVWDHPDNLQRQVLARSLCEQRGTTAQGLDGHTGNRHNDCTFKNGNATVVHEFGHFLHLPHATPTGGVKESALHDQNDLKCIMNYDPDALHLCGGCLLRLRGWAFFKKAPIEGFSNTNPDQAGQAAPAADLDSVNTLFGNFYAAWV